MYSSWRTSPEATAVTAGEEKMPESAATMMMRELDMRNQKVVSVKREEGGMCRRET